MERARVVAVEGGGGPGSGYVIAPLLVLTSAHVVPAPGMAVSLYRPGRAQKLEGSVVWRGTPGGRDDAALVRIDDPAWVPPPGTPVRWGRLATDRPGTACEAWGVPDLVQRPGRATDTLQPSGAVNPGDRRIGNRYVMNLAQHPPDPAADGSSPWGGMSGAALFCGGLLAGVVTVDPAGRGHAHLEAVPAYVLLHDAGFRAALLEYGVGTVLEPVEWQELAEAAGPGVTGLAGSPAALLRARRQVVPFRGRTAVLADLHAWATEPGFGARLLHGPGGQGKTRLAQHFADTLTAESWTTVWLRREVTPDVLELLSAAAVPLLLVVDYAETRTPQLSALLDVAARHGGGSAFKVLLLARTWGDWWQGLQADSPVAEDLLDGARAVLLPALEPEPGPSRTQAYHEAVGSFAAQLPYVRGWQGHDWAGLAGRLGHDSGLDRPGLESALTLHMTALADLLDTAGPGDSSSGGTGTQGVEDRLLVHERRYWTTAATAHGLHPGLTLATLTDALAAAFLLGAEDRGEADTLLDRVPGLADQPADRRGAVRDWIAALYPAVSPDQPWDSLQPDRLAERFIGRHLHDNPGLADHLVPAATGTQAAQLLTVYTRAAAHPVFAHRLDPHLTALCVRHPAVLAPPAIDVATQTEAPRALLAALHQITDNPETPLSDLEQHADRLPYTSHNLAPWAAHLAQHITDRQRARAQQSPDHLPDLARSLNNLSGRLGDVGRWEEGLAVITEAVEAYRELVGVRPDAFLPDLARSLNNLSVRLGDVRRWEEGLAVITEAVGIRRELARVRPDAFLPDLASSLNNLSVRLGDVGRWEEGLAVITEAVDVYRGLARVRPDAFLPDLAMSLHNLSIDLGALGRREEALAAITEAVDIRRELARLRPEVHQSELDRSLGVLSRLQNDE